MIKLRTGSCGQYYGSVWGTSEPLREHYQMETNALYVYNYLTKRGWTLNAIAGILGNMQAESTINPGRWQGDNVGHGPAYGIVQWDHWTKYVEDWCYERGYTDPSEMDHNLERIIWELETGAQYYKNYYPYTFKTFSKSTNSPYILACAFAFDYERSGTVINGSEAEKETLRQTRGGYANNWYNYLVKATFKARLNPLDESMPNPLYSPYWITNNTPDGKLKGGLNIYPATEQYRDTNRDGIRDYWRENVPAKDKDILRGTYSTLPDCVAWAWGRAYEITLEEPPKFNIYAGKWWDISDSELEKKGYSRNTTTPALGAIMCWRSRDASNSNSASNNGHVAIVEAIHDDGTVSFSESGYDSWKWRNNNYINVQKRKNPVTAYSARNYEFLGYIHLPAVVSAPIPTITPTIITFKTKLVNTTSVDFQLEIDASSSTLGNSYYIIRSATGSSKKQFINISSGVNNFSVGSLVPNTEYDISIELHYGEGQVITSKKLEFVTTQDYPDPINDISLALTGKNLESETFKVSIKKPERWGYWKGIGNDYGYRVFIISDCKLLKSYDDIKMNNLFYITPSNYDIKPGNNLQVGISSWVTDGSGQKVFAQPGGEFPVSSNSIFITDTSEIQDTCYLVKGDKINRVQPYTKVNTSGSFKPVKIFKI